MRFPAARTFLGAVLALPGLVACGDREAATATTTVPVAAESTPIEPAVRATPAAQPPLEPMTLYLAGLQVLKDDVGRQSEVHRYCAQPRPDFAQCVVFDGSSRDAHLIGVEYIISESLFQSLPREEQAYWHPRNYSVLSGQLLAPQVALSAEKTLMQEQLNTYAKAWQFWDGDRGVQPPQPLPLGPARLAWSFNHDEEAQPGLLRRYSEEIGIDPVEKQRERMPLAEQARPQAGADLLHDRFKDRPAEPVQGVLERRAAQQTEQPQDAAPPPVTDPRP